MSSGYVLDNGMPVEQVCLPCRLDEHDECSWGFRGALLPEQPCCCEGGYDLIDHHKAMRGHGGGDEAAPHGGGAQVWEIEGPKTGPHAAPAAAIPPRYGDSGYIHPDAWGSTSDIGTLTDPESTGRKRVKRMFPIPQGMACEWAGMKNCGGGVEPITGCIRNPAQDLHHGPDKNTLNNAKASHQIGDQENVHLICSFCHNTWHARNNGYYPPFDRVADQEKPWLPYSEGPWGPQQMEPATLEELLEEERRRRAEDAKNGRATGNGRVGRRAEGDVGPVDDD